MSNHPWRLCAILCGASVVVGCADDSQSDTSGAGASSGSGTSASGSTTTSTGNGSTTSTGTASGGGGAGTGGGASTGGSGGGGGAAPGGLVRFVAIGDTGKGNQGQTDVGNAIAAKCAASGCDFVQLLGDNIYDSGADSPTDGQFQSKFEQPYAAVDLPFWVVLGNHDYGGNGSGVEFGKGQNEIDYTQNSLKWTLPAAYYHHSMQHVEFFALDTNMAMFGQDADQQSDFPTWFSQSLATWRIAFGHHPYLSNGPHGNAGEYDGLPFVPITNGEGVKDLLEGVVCGQADVYICGHDHNLQWLTGTCSGTELLVSGGGASTTALEGSNPVYFESDSLGFLYVRIEDNSFTGEFYDTAGTLLGARTFTK